MSQGRLLSCSLRCLTRRVCFFLEIEAAARQVPSSSPLLLAFPTITFRILLLPSCDLYTHRFIYEQITNNGVRYADDWPSRRSTGYVQLRSAPAYCPPRTFVLGRPHGKLSRPAIRCPLPRTGHIWIRPQLSTHRRPVWPSYCMRVFSHHSLHRTIALPAIAAVPHELLAPIIRIRPAAAWLPWFETFVQHIVRNCISHSVQMKNVPTKRVFWIGTLCLCYVCLCVYRIHPLCQASLWLRVCVVVCVASQSRAQVSVPVGARIRPRLSAWVYKGDRI